MKIALFAAFFSICFVLHAESPMARVPKAQGTAKLKELKSKLDRVRNQLAQLESFFEQVKSIQIGLIRLKQVVSRLERASHAPKELDRKIDQLTARILDLERRVEELRQRKVYNEHLQAQRSSTTGVRAGYDGGFYIASSDKRYLLKVGGVLRLVFRAGEVAQGGVLEPPEKLDLTTVSLPTGILQFGGNVFTKKLTYFIELEFGGGNTVVLNDFMLSYRICKYFGVTLGQFPVGFSEQLVLDPYDTLFIDSSPAAVAFGPGRDIGLKLQFYQGRDRFFQELAVYNGGGYNANGSGNTNFMYQARVGAAPYGGLPATEGDLRTGARPFRFRVAFSYLFIPMLAGRDLDRIHGQDNIFVHQVSGELAAIMHGFSLNGEIYFRSEDHGKAVTQLDPPERRLASYFGGFAQLSYLFRRIGLQLSARYSYVEPVAFWRSTDDSLVYAWTSPVSGIELGPNEEALVPDRVHEASGAVTWYPTWLKHHLKLVLSYTYLAELGYTLAETSDKESRHIHMVSLLVQARF